MFHQAGQIFVDYLQAATWARINLGCIPPGARISCRFKTQLCISPWVGCLPIHSSSPRPSDPSCCLDLGLAAPILICDLAFNWIASETRVVMVYAEDINLDATSYKR